MIDERFDRYTISLHYLCSQTLDKHTLEMPLKSRLQIPTPISRREPENKIELERAIRFNVGISQRFPTSASSNTRSEVLLQQARSQASFDDAGKSGCS